MKLTQLGRPIVAQRKAGPQPEKASNTTRASDNVLLGQIPNPQAGEPYEPDFITPKSPAKPDQSHAGEPYEGYAGGWQAPDQGDPIGLNATLDYDAKTGTLTYHFPHSQDDGSVPFDIVAHERAAERQREMQPNPHFGEPYEPAEVAVAAPLEPQIFRGYD